MARRTFALLAFAALAAGGGVALAQGGSDPYELPEPKLRAGEVVGLAEVAGCDADGRVKIRFRPPAGAVFGFFSVSVDGREAARLTGVPRAASATVALRRTRQLARARRGRDARRPARADPPHLPPLRHASDAAHAGLRRPGPERRRRGLSAQAPASARVGSGAPGSGGSGTSGVRATTSAWIRCRIATGKRTPGGGGASSAS